MNLSSDLKYLIYKTTNLVNGKFYMGKHQTRNLDDGYQGSGKWLKRAINKYGQENFVTEILEIYDQEWKMNLAERILVITDPEVSYNLCSGGKGGFGYINQNELSLKFSLINRKGRIFTKEHKKKISEAAKGNTRGFQKGHKIWTGRKHSEETKQKMRNSKNFNLTTDVLAG